MISFLARRTAFHLAVGAGSLSALFLTGVTATASSHTATRSPAVLTTHAAPHPQLTTAARHAGLQLGNAPMGWRHSKPGVAHQSPIPPSPSVPIVPLPTPPTGAPVLGLDVSSYQGNVNWASWTGKGRSFAFVKATEGTSYRNPYFASQNGGAARAGMFHGAYHFASPSGQAGYLQARYFVANGGGWSARDGKTLPGVLDIEYNPYGATCYGLSQSAMVAWTTSFTTEYKRLTGKDAIIYSTTDWWRQCTGNSAAFALTNPLWIARYGTSSPGTLPAGWGAWTFWQYTSDPVDQDRFSSTTRRLKVLATVTSAA